MAVTGTPLFTVGGKGSFGDLIAGSWSITEDATPLDILDTSGSTGTAGASFKRIPEYTIGVSPLSTPIPSSDFLLDQQAALIHPVLGSFNGYVTSSDANTPGQVDISLNSALDSLNDTITAPAYVHGNPMYSFPYQDNAGNVRPFARAMATDAVGNVVVTGSATGTNATIKYDRFGNFLFGMTHAQEGLDVALDSSGNIYVQGTSIVYSFNGTNGNVIASPLITAGAGINFVYMTIDSSNVIYIATTDTAGGAAIKKYSTAGVASTTFGTYDPTYTGSGTPTTSTTFAKYTGMGTDGTNIYISKSTYIPSYGVYYGEVRSFTSSGTVGSYYAQNPQMQTPVSIDWYWGGPSNTILSIAQWQSAPFTPGNFYVGTPSGGLSSWNADLAPVNPYSLVPMAADHSGGGFWIGQGSKIWRLAGGYLPHTAALEMYVGISGYKGSISYSGGQSQYDPNNYGEFIGFTGNAWTYIKQLCARNSYQITNSGSGIIVKKVTGYIAGTKIDISNRQGSPQITQDAATGQQINATIQNTSAIQNQVVYQQTQNDSVISVAPGEVYTTTIKTNTWMNYVLPPSASNGLYTKPISDYIGGPGFLYAVSDSTSPLPLQVSTSTWEQYGGRIVVSVNESDPTSVDVKITGAGLIPGFTGNWQMGFPQGTMINPSGFGFRGSGVSFNPVTIQILTGADPRVSSNLNTADMSSPFITNASVAYNLAINSSVNQGHGQLKISLSIPITTSMTLGNVAGTYFVYSRRVWRVTSVTFSGGLAQLTAVNDERVIDDDPTSLTVGQYDTLWSGYRNQDQFLSPGVLNP